MLGLCLRIKNLWDATDALARRLWHDATDQVHWFK